MNATPTLYEWAGGKAAIRRLMGCFYDRVERDELLSPYFPGGVSEEHRAHVAAWWSEVLGGPARYTEDLRGYTHRSLAGAGGGASLSALGRETRSVSTSTCSGQGLIDRHYACRPDMPALARGHASTAHFSLSFKRAFVETPHQYLRMRGTGARGGARELSNNDRSKEER